MHKRMVVGSGLIQHGHSVSKHGLQMVKLNRRTQPSLRWLVDTRGDRAVCYTSTRMTETRPTFDDGAAYDEFMGRWSRAVGAVFLDWLAAPGRRRGSTSAAAPARSPP